MEHCNKEPLYPDQQRLLKISNNFFKNLFLIIKESYFINIWKMLVKALEIPVQIRV